MFNSITRLKRRIAFYTFQNGLPHYRENDVSAHLMIKVLSYTIVRWDVSWMNKINKPIAAIS